jgi:hypothetical protein
MKVAQRASQSTRLRPLGGSFFADPPEVAAPQARVLWDPDLCSAVCRARVEHAESSGISLLACASRFIVLRTPDGTQHVLIENRDRTLQLAVVGADVTRPVRITTAIPVRAQRLAAHLWMAKCLHELCSKGGLPRGHPHPRQRRLRIVLQALDGWLAGASHRDISCALFGEKRTKADWTDPSNHLRDTTRRAVRRGRLLMNGGYKALLRQL